MWRNTKKNVINELKIPPQEEEIIFLTFSPSDSLYLDTLIFF